MEKQIRNAGKRTPPPGKVKRRHLPSLPESTNGTGEKRQDDETLRTLPGLPGTTKQDAKTIEVVDGIPQFFIVIPCMAGNPDRKSPLYLVEESKLGGAESGVWQCQECGRIYHTRKAWSKHAGMISNIMGNCPGG